MTDQKSFPVRYMVIELRQDVSYFIIDTSYEGGGIPICDNMFESWAHHICRLLNEAEGYRYDL